MPRHVLHVFLIFLTITNSQNYSPISSFAPVDLQPFRPSLISPDASNSALCEIPLSSGLTSSGVCVNIGSAPGNTFPSLGESLPFCGEYLLFPVCVPARQPLFPGWDAVAKDSLLKTQFEKNVAARISLESQATIDTTDDGINDLFIPVRFTQNLDCVRAFKKALCFANFPRCGTQSLPVCPATCSSFEASCRYFTGEVCHNGWPFEMSRSANLSSLNSTEVVCTGSAFGSTATWGAVLGLLLMVLA